MQARDEMLNGTKSFEMYQNSYESLRMERTASGVLTVTMHTQGSSHVYAKKSYHELSNAFWDIARDRENEVVILTGTGDAWIRGFDTTSLGDISQPQAWHYILAETRRLLYNMLDVEVPMIAVVNGPAPIHGEYALLADIVLAADTAYFQDQQYVGAGVVPANGAQVIWSEVIGPNRAHYFLLTGQKITAQEALHWGAVNEVLPRNQLMKRAYELALALLQIPSLTRRYTRLMMTKRLKGLLNENLPGDLALKGISHTVVAQEPQ
jgi:enoyl-CoA hydratase/carnithine racemase